MHNDGVITFLSIVDYYLEGII